MSQTRDILQAQCGKAADAIVQYATVPQSLDIIASLFRFLTADEKERAERFHFQKDRSQFVTAHALLHYCLQCAGLKAPPDFTTNPFGKPKLILADADHVLNFNLSHSRIIAACAVSTHGEVGIDVEFIDERLSFEEIASLSLTENEHHRLSSLPPAERNDMFYRLWTLKEAIIKGLGMGLSLSMQDFTFTLEPPALQSSPLAATGENRWHVEQRRIATNYYCAVALQCPAESHSISVGWQDVSIDDILRKTRI
jgi:4'-phosphopantetheinyl transferase